MEIAPIYHSLFSTVEDIPWQMDLEFNLTWIDPRISSLTGFTPEEFLGQPFEKFLTQPSRERARKNHRYLKAASLAVDANDRPFFPAFLVEMKTRDGMTICLEIHTTYHLDDSGTLVGFQGIARKMNSGNSTGSSAVIVPESGNLFRTLLENLGEGIGVIDSRNRFIFANAAANTIFHLLPPVSLEGRLLDEFIVSDQIAQLQEQIRRYPPGSANPFQVQIHRPDGTERTLSVTATLWSLPGRAPAGILGIFRDITETLQSEEELRQSEARYRAIVEDQSELILRFLPSGKITFANDAYCNYFGFSREDISGSNMMTPISVSDRPRIHAQLFALNQACPAVTYEIRVRLPDGSYRWQQRTDRIIFDERGHLAEYQSVARDVDERKLAEDSLKAARAQLAERVNELEERNKEMNLLTQMNNDLVFANHIVEACQIAAHYAQQLFPATSGTILTINWDLNELENRQSWGKAATGLHHATHPEACLAIESGQIHNLPEGDPSFICQRITHPGPSSAICIPLHSQGRVIGIFHLATTLGELPILENQRRMATVVAEQFSLALSNIELRENLRQQAIRDSLTGLFNRYFMESSLESELKRTERSGKPVSLVMLDIDHFKEFNDTCSHPAGDLLLAELGKLLRSSIRSGDIACRYGGEEFLLILPETALDVAKDRAEFLRSQVESIQLTHEGRPLPPVCISLGVASHPEHGKTVKDLLQAVDNALYRAKEQGRNRVVAASD